MGIMQSESSPVFVPGEGPVPSKGMIIGEAPGRTEALLGRPFVGPSGKLLDQALIALAVPRESVYITNVVKTLPLTADGKIRKPTHNEEEKWKAKLHMEIKQSRAYGILALGKTAQEFLSRNGWPFYEAWHPAYVLRRHGGLSTEWLEQIRPWAEVVRRAS